MKLFTSLFASILLTVILPGSSFAANLACWQVAFPNVQAPFMTAKIMSNTTLANIRFLYKNSAINDGTGSESDTLGTIKGQIETSPYSPYKGNATYKLLTGDTLVLPPRLSKDYLQFILPMGIGYQANENAVIMGSYSNHSTGGNRFSFRMVCHSDNEFPIAD